MSVPSLEVLLDLVALIYELASSDDGWDRFLAATARVFDASAAIFFVHDRREPELAFARLWGRPDVALEQYESHFAGVDIGIDTLLERAPMTVITEEDIPPEEFASSEILNDFRRPWSVEHFVGGDVFRDGRRFGMLSLQASRDRGSFDASERYLVGQLLPHLGRAVRLRMQFEKVQIRHAVFEDLVESLLVGAVVMDGRGVVIHANAAARRIIRRRDGLTISNGRLRAASRADDRALCNAIAAAIDTTRRAGLGGGGALSVARPSGERSWSVLVCAGPGRASDSPLRSASAIVLIGDPGRRMESDPERVGRLYGLTRAQSRLASAIASGESIESYAERCGITQSTARWTLKQVLARTGATRQADLVRLLLTGPAALAKPPSEPDGPGPE